MGADLFIVTGELDSLKDKVRLLDKTIMNTADPDDINWELVSDLADQIQDAASNLQGEAEEGLE